MSQFLLRSNKKNTLIISDFDGTLVSLNVDWIKLKKTLITLLESESRYRYVINDGLIQNLEKIKNPELKQKAYELIDKHENQGLLNAKKNWDLIKKLRENDFVIISHNNEKVIKNFLKEVGCSHFTLIFSKEDLETVKSESQKVEEMLCRVTSKYKYLIYYGDSAEDKKLAVKLGAEFVEVKL